MSWAVDIDGTDITPLCQSIVWRQRLNAPASTVVRLPAHLSSFSTGDTELHLYDNGNLVFSGPTWYVQADGTPDSTYVEITAYDHLIYLNNRQCKTVTGNLIQPDSVITANVTAPAIMQAFINNVNTYDSTVPNGNAMPLTPGSVDGGGDDLTSVPTNFPMTLEQMRSLLCSTGQLNLLVNPGVGSSTVDLTNGGVVNDLSGSVVFQYGTGAYNSQIATFTVDAKHIVNALWYLLGPRCSLTRWKGSITPTAPHAGGSWPAALVAQFSNSRTAFGYSQEIRIFDDAGGQCFNPDDTTSESAARPLFEEEWANEAWIRAVPQTFATVRPQRGTEAGCSPGDLISVAAGSVLYGGFSGTQVVFELETSMDVDGVVEVTELITSADQNGAP